jgi:hypothetical protein
MNKWMDQMVNERREFNVRMVVKWVNTNMDEFVADNTNMNDVDFEDVFKEHWEHLG